MIKSMKYFMLQHKRQQQQQQQQQKQQQQHKRQQQQCLGYNILVVIVILLCFDALIVGTVAHNGRSRRRPTIGTAATKQSIEEVSEKSSVPDQIALAASRADGQQFKRRGNTASSSNSGGNKAAQQHSDAERDYAYGSLELNLVRPEHETVHSKRGSHYKAPISLSAETSLEDSETAAEYVANAMKLAYGTRLKEPIHILSETEKPTALSSTISSVSASSHEESNGISNMEYYERLKKQQQQMHAAKNQQIQQQMQEHQQQHQQQQQQLIQSNEEHKAQAQAQAQAQALHQAQTQQQQQQHQQQQAQAQALLEAQMQAELHSQLAQQAQLLAVDTQTEQQQTQSQPAQPAPVYEKDPVTRSYEVYDDGSGNSALAGTIGIGNVYDDDEHIVAGVDRHYRTKYVFHEPQQLQSHSTQLYRNTPSLEQDAEEKIRVSASTEIPKAEIMKQIEKSVLKYMKELEAEGKIITAPQEPAKSYYKLMAVPSTEEKQRYASTTTTRPKYNGGAATSFHSSSIGVGSSSGSNGAASNSAGMRQHSHATHLNKHAASSNNKPRYQSETETAYQAPDMADALAPNVEFIYKIKTRAPLQTATVKTVSKPYTLPLKTGGSHAVGGSHSGGSTSGATYDHFDHSAALKNIEEFDLSHVVTTPENDERLILGTSTSKPNKLYFNSDIYHDINSLPYKSEKLRASLEYRNKLKELHPDYKGYTSGYFAEPAAAALESLDKELSGGGNANTDEGYALVNPYHYVLKKEPLPSKYEDTASGSASWEQPTRANHAKPIYNTQKLISGAAGGGAGTSSLEYDSYSPKFNNNPEGYGYQHTYKTHVLRHVNGGGGAGGGGGIKRGKRGGSASNIIKKTIVRGSGAAVKDIEANLALRPPPKN